MIEQNSKANLKQLWGHLSNRRKQQLGLLLILMLLASTAEIISIGAVIPFLGVMTAPEEIYQHHLIQPIIQLLQLTDPKQLLLPITVIFILAALFAGSIRIVLIYVTTRLSYAIGADLSISIYRRTLYQDYSVHIRRNSSEVINGIINKTGNTIIVMQAVLVLVSSIVLTIFILATLFMVNTAVALYLFVGFGFFYVVVTLYTRRKLQENSKIIAEKSTRTIKVLQEGLGGIRDILIDSCQDFYCQLYRSADLPTRKAQGDNAFIIQSPRYVMESIGIVLIAALTYVITLQESGMSAAIPALGALVLGAQRLLPALQQIYGAYSSIKGSYSSFNDALDLLNQPLPSYADQLKNKLPLNKSSLHEELSCPFQFKREISINNLGFYYNQENNKRVLKNINLTIPKGSHIGFIGKTGSGKSTLLDIIMGLFLPTEGQLTIDGQEITVNNRRSWQEHITHVPQNIYLSDSTIEENIAFGVPQAQINHKRVKEAVEYAQLSSLINGWPQRYQTVVGEQGVRLSGGQRQRIGIARALYKHADVIILDEATSALDSKTEQSVMEAIESISEKVTILIIAHRLTTLKGCDQVVQLEEGSLTHIGEYKDIVSRKNELYNS